MIYTFNMLICQKYEENKAIRKDVSKLYVDAFPRNERPPVNMFFRSFHKDSNHLFAFYEKEEFIGFCSTITYKDISYIFFLAVSKNYRQQGYGTEILSHMKKIYKDYVIVLCYEEVDKKYKDYDLREKRRQFYSKNGFQYNGFNTIEFGVNFSTCYYGKHPISFLDYQEIFRLGFGEFALNFLKMA